jgi:hypothetical protein
MQRNQNGETKMLELDAAWDKLNEMTSELAGCEAAEGCEDQQGADVEEGCKLQDELAALTKKIESWQNRVFATA